MVQQKSGTKYAFASTRQSDLDVGTKVCPRCGQVLFEDMDTCFDCLYSFVKDTHRPKGPAEYSPPRVADVLPMPGTNASAAMPGRVDDLLSSIELDEIDEVEEDELIEPVVEPMANARHRKREPSSQEDTLDLATLDMTKVANPESPSLQAVIRGKDMQVRMPLSKHGLTIGRGEDNDVILRSRLVSRQHLSLIPHGDGVVVQDRGATNPAIVHGKPLEGSARIKAGDLVDICGITLELAEMPAKILRSGKAGLVPNEKR